MLVLNKLVQESESTCLSNKVKRCSSSPVDEQLGKPLSKSYVLGHIFLDDFGKTLVLDVLGIAPLKLRLKVP